MKYHIFEDLKAKIRWLIAIFGDHHTFIFFSVPLTVTGHVLLPCSGESSVSQTGVGGGTDLKWSANRLFGQFFLKINYLRLKPIINK